MGFRALKLFSHAGVGYPKYSHASLPLGLFILFCNSAYIFLEVGKFWREIKALALLLNKALRIEYPLFGPDGLSSGGL